MAAANHTPAFLVAPGTMADVAGDPKLAEQGGAKALEVEGALHTEASETIGSKPSVTAQKTITAPSRHGTWVHAVGHVSRGSGQGPLACKSGGAELARGLGLSRCGGVGAQPRSQPLRQGRWRAGDTGGGQGRPCSHPTPGRPASCRRGGTHGAPWHPLAGHHGCHRQRRALAHLLLWLHGLDRWVSLLPRDARALCGAGSCGMCAPGLTG